MKDFSPLSLTWAITRWSLWYPKPVGANPNQIKPDLTWPKWNTNKLKTTASLFSINYKITQGGVGVCAQLGTFRETKINFIKIWIFSIYYFIVEDYCFQQTIYKTANNWIIEKRRFEQLKNVINVVSPLRYY